MSNSGDLGRKFSRSATWVFAEQWTSKFVSIALFAVLARILNPSDFGLVALATSVIAIVQVFVNSGFSKALIQKRVLTDDDSTTAFWTSLALSIVLYAALILTAPLISQLFSQPQLRPILIVLGAVLPLSALSRTPAALLARDFQFASLSVRTVIATLVGAVVALPLALAGAGVWALVGQALTEALVAVVVLWSSTAWRPKLRYSVDSLRSLWRTGLSLLGIELLDTIQSNMDKLVIGVMFSTSDLGVYALAQRVGLILQEVMTSVMTKVSLTTFSRAQEDIPRVARIFRQMTYATATISFPAFAISAALATQIIPFMFGPGWEAAIPLVWILAGGWAFAAIAMYDRSALVGTGYAGAAFWLAFVQNLISILLVFLFAPLGIIGIALSRAARISTWPIRLIVLRRLIGLRVLRYLLQTALSVCAVAPAVIVLAILQQTPWAQSDHAFWSFAVPLGIVSYIASVALGYAFAGAETRAALRNQIRHLTKRRKGSSGA